MTAEAAALTAFLLAFSLALISPGPAVALLLSTSVRGGRAAALRVGVGLGLGDLSWGLLAVLGVAALAARYPWISLSIRIGGGCFLLWLAFSSLRAAFSQAPAGADRTDSRDDASVELRGIRHGFLLNALNPKAGVFWLSLTGLLLQPDLAAWVPLTAVAVATLMSIGWHCLLATAFTTPAVESGYRRLQRRIEAVLGVVLGALGVKLLTAS
jgi:threonine/homoserine/homoserine lactone efflux protein